VFEYRRLIGFDFSLIECVTESGVIAYGGMIICCVIVIRLLLVN
jgi:hypothetical protein